MSEEKILFQKNPAFDKCPSCGELFSLRRSHSRNSFENILKFTGIFKIYRCKKCGWRGTKSTFTLKVSSLKLLLWYAILIIITAGIVRIVITKFVK